jgi:hypothetical protein
MAAVSRAAPCARTISSIGSMSRGASRPAYTSRITSSEPRPRKRESERAGAAA